MTNWFERYGIVGIYYVILSIGWLETSGLLEPLKDSEIIVAVGAIFAAISIPIGYLLSILSQNIYYLTLPESMQVHKTVLRKLSSLLPNYEEIKNYDESTLEVYLGIKLHSENELEYRKFLKEPISKRWDVLSISFSLFIATLLAYLPVGAIKLITNNSLQSFLPTPCHFSMALLLLLFSAIVIIILEWSRELMFEQIIEIYTMYYKDLFNASRDYR